MKAHFKKLMNIKDTQTTAQLTAGVYDMKKHYKKGGTFTLSALLTSLICASLPVAQASDIDIYQEAKKGDVTLMFVIDISGSMGYPQLGSGSTSQCDLPNGSKYKNYGNDNSTNGLPIYKRYYCTATGSERLYKYRSYVEKKTTYYQVCKDAQINYADCNWLTRTTTKPSGSTDGTEVNGIYTNYYSLAEENFYDRITRVKDGMFDLLNGNVSKNIPRLADDKVIGLTTYSTPLTFNTAGEPQTADNVSGKVRIPARRLDAVVGGITHRQLLLNEIAVVGARGGTPTANAYAEAASYLMGTTTAGKTERGIIGYTTTSNTSRFYACTAPTTTGGCSSYSGSYTTPLPSYDSATLSGTIYYLYRNNIAVSASSGFANAASDTKNSTNYIQPTSISSQLTNTQGQQCSGQGIYVLTDGVPSNNDDAKTLMKQALASSGNSFDCANSGSGWDCINQFNLNLLDKAKNPVGLKFKTAVVGFGKDFTADDLKSYDKNLTQAQNIANIDASSAGSDQKNAAKWGVYGEGGWYSGSSSDDVVNSVNNFINNLNTDIPAVTTGSPTIPVDSLNTISLQPWAYFPQFQPTPDRSYQIWFGNLKKYKNLNGTLKDRDGVKVVSKTGEIVKGTIDFWAPIVTPTSTDSEKDAAKIGGALMKLPLRFSTQVVNGNTVTIQRNLLTDRSITDSTTGASQAGSSLSTITKDYIGTADPDRGYLMNLLGYRVDATNPSGITAASLQKAEELRQIGGVMHSSPVLLNQKGKIQASNNKITSINRDDYILFGSTQGLLQVVDAITGVEKFAFVPDEMIRNQKEAFLEKTVTTGGLSKMYYGIDGPWTAYTSYVPTGTDGYLTVGSGKNSASGRQWVYGGLRMGGRSYYSLDLSNMNSPKLKFRIDPDSATAGTPLSYMGQSWSKPTITWVNWKGKRKLVMFVGGGYDAGGTNGKGVNGVYQGYESDSYDQTSKIGAGVYMFDADDGSLLWWSGANVSADVNTKTGINAKQQVDMKYSVVSRINAVDRNADGLVDHLYFGDLGGQVWRVDLDNTLTSASTAPFAKNAIRLLNLNLSSGKSPRFYEAPAFTVYNEPGVGRFAVVNVGSGNRSKPLADYTGDETATGRYADAVYAIYDKDVTNNKLYEMTAFTTQNKTRANLTEVTNRSTKVAYGSADGWYYKLIKGSKLQSEKVIGDLIAINYNLYVGVFDGSKPGLSGDCGAGVKGASFVERFCLPYSDCSNNPTSTLTSDKDNRLPQGAGIIPPTIGGDCTDSSCDQTTSSTSDGRQIVANCEGAECDDGKAVRLINTPRQRLIPLRWYEEYANPTKVGS